MRWTAVAVLCSMVMTGCAGKPERADTVPMADDPSQVVVTTKATQAPAPTQPPVGRSEKLSAVQAKRALLTLEDMPTGWTQEKPDPDDGDDETVTPKRCAAVFDALDERDPLTEAEATFSAGDFGPSLDHSVGSWPNSQVPALKQIAQALRQCPKFTSRSKDGSSATFQATGLSFPNLGDHTLALRLKGKSEGITVVVDVVYIAKGNNALALVVSGLQPLDGATFEKLARAAVTRLDAAVK